MRWWDVEPSRAIELRLFADDPWTAELFWSELAHVPDTRWYVVAVDADDVLVGYAGLMAVGSDADVQTVAVEPSVQGAGLGRRLLAELLDEARRRGCRRVFLEVRTDNVAAIALYDSEGFEHNARRSDYYGPGVDALVLRLDLAAATP